MPSPQEYNLKVRRTARYYTLGDEKSESMWFVLHGYGNLARTFIELFRPIEEHACIVAPEALSRFYPSGFTGKAGASWMTREDRLNEIDDYIHYLNDLYHEVTSGNRPKKLTVLGFSQGCPAVMRWTASGTIKPDHVLVWSGDVPRDLNFDAYKQQMGNSKTWMIYGEQDKTLAHTIYHESAMLLESHGISYETIKFSGGHEIQADVLSDVQLKIGV